MTQCPQEAPRWGKGGQAASMSLEGAGWEAAAAAGAQTHAHKVQGGEGWGQWVSKRRHERWGAHLNASSPQRPAWPHFHLHSLYFIIFFLARHHSWPRPVASHLVGSLCRCSWQHVSWQHGGRWLQMPPPLLALTCCMAADALTPWPLTLCSLTLECRRDI